MVHTNNKGTSKVVSKSLLKKLVERVESLVISKKEGRGRCWKIRPKPNGRGYPQFTYKGTRYMAHRVMACKKRDGTLRRYPVYNKATRIQASHRCGFTWCCNPRHLVYEPEPYNQTRDCCHRVGIKTRGYLCPHSPRCTHLKGVVKYRKYQCLHTPSRRYHIRYIGRTFILGFKKNNNNK